MITSWQVAPGTSTPCQSDSVPKRLAFSSWMNRLVSSGNCASPWHKNRQRRQPLPGVDGCHLGGPTGREEPERPSV